MSFNLVDAVKSLFTDDLAAKMASSFGESKIGIQKAIGGAIPAVVAGLLEEADTQEGASHVFHLSKEAAGSGVLNNLAGFTGNDNLISKGLEWLEKLFGNKVDNITGYIARFAGIGESSAASVLSTAVAAVLGTLGRQVTQQHLNVSGLTSLLASQKESLLKAQPLGLNLAAALGLGSLSEVGSKLTGGFSHSTYTTRTTATKAGSGGNKWLLPLLLALIVIGVLFYFTKGCNQQAGDIAVTPSADTTQKTPAAEAPAPPSLAAVKVKLPDGTELDAYQGGIEDKLVAFLNDPDSRGGKDVWFDFDNLNFKTGSAELMPESMKQVNNIAAILKAYPKLKIKIGGYTDKSGDASINKKLSQERADAVLALLKSTGANSDQLVGAEGYGAEFAKAAADAPDEERRKDRRIAVSVREK